MARAARARVHFLIMPPDPTPIRTGLIMTDRVAHAKSVHQWCVE
jgi:hypothetical protein